MTPRLPGILRRWLRRSGDAHAAAAGDAPPPAPVDADCRPAPWVVQQGFARVFAGVELGAVPQESLEVAFQDALRSGSGGIDEDAVAALLAGSGWRWPEFERWEEAFGTRRQWPDSWQRYPSLAAAATVTPRGVAEALPYFSYLERRDLLNALTDGRKSAPIRVEELERTFLESFSWDELAPLAFRRYEEFLVRSLQSRERDLARLLVHHLHRTVYNLVAFHQGRTAAGNGLLRYRWEVVADGEPLAAEAAAAFNRGESETIPPYFPGDSSRLRLIRV